MILFELIKFLRVIEVLIKLFIVILLLIILFVMVLDRDIVCLVFWLIIILVLGLNFFDLIRLLREIMLLFFLFIIYMFFGWSRFWFMVFWIVIGLDLLFGMKWFLLGFIWFFWIILCSESLFRVLSKFLVVVGFILEVCIVLVSDMILLVCKFLIILFWRLMDFVLIVFLRE